MAGGIISVDEPHIVAAADHATDFYSAGTSSSKHATDQSDTDPMLMSFRTDYREARSYCAELGQVVATPLTDKERAGLWISRRSLARGPVSCLAAVTASFWKRGSFRSESSGNRQASAPAMCKMAAWCAPITTIFTSNISL